MKRLEYGMFMYNIKRRNLLATAIISVISFSLGYLSNVFITKNDTTKVDSFIAKNNLLSRCKRCSRELAFLEKGGEYFVDYENPRTLNDKIGYILNNYFQKSPITQHIGNKYLAKKYVADSVGEEHVVKMFGIWDSPKDVEWEKLPNKFVIKSVRGHFGKQVIIIKDKNNFDISTAIKQLEDFCLTPGMLDIKKNRIIAEEYLESTNEDGTSRDYKFFCSYGRVLVACCLVANNNSCDVDAKTSSFYSVPEWKRLPFKINNRSQNLIAKPKHFDKMISLAEKLSVSFPLIRVDLYEIGDRVLVGELTEDACGGKYIFSPVIWDFELGKMFDVPSKDELELLIKKDEEKYKTN